MSMADLPALHELQKLEFDIDLRLTDLWRSAAELEEGDWNVEVTMAFARAAYGQGYTDCLKDPDPEALFREHGYQVPERRKG